MIQKIREYGFYTKGLIYIILGVLTLLAALNLGGKVTDKNGAITFLENQIFGKVLLIILGLGLFSYAIWRFYKSYLVVKEENDKTKYVLCIDYFLRGIIYGSLAITVLYKVINQSKEGFSRETLAHKILNIDNGELILYLIALIILISALNQFFIVYKSSFLKGIKKDKNMESYTFLKRTGKFGITSRGISFVIFAYFIFKASQENNANQVKGTQEMFTYLHELTFGSILMSIMALGFISYGIFQYFFGRYSNS